MGKSIVLLRHGNRDTSNRELDNGLDHKGKIQAAQISNFFGYRYENVKSSDVWLVSSPKLRCIETISPLAESLQAKLNIHPSLDERTAVESKLDFHERINQFFKDWKKRPEEVTVVSSHGDWLPTAVASLIGISYNCKKGSWLELESIDGTYELSWFSPSLKRFK